MSDSAVEPKAMTNADVAALHGTSTVVFAFAADSDDEIDIHGWGFVYGDEIVPRPFLHWEGRETDESRIVPGDSVVKASAECNGRLNGGVPYCTVDHDCLVPPQLGIVAERDGKLVFQAAKA